jgi:hypothetical protein
MAMNFSVQESCIQMSETESGFTNIPYETYPFTSKEWRKETALQCNL